MSKKVAPKKDKLETVRQNIFSAKTEKEKRMWENVLRKLESKK